MGRKPRFEFDGDADCPTCGAIPSKQKWKPRKRLTDISQADAIDRLSPVDAVKCGRCGRDPLRERRDVHHGLVRTRDCAALLPVVRRGGGA